MALLVSLALFILVMLIVTLVGLKVWVRPKEAMERVAGVAVEQREHASPHPSLAFHEVLQKLGNMLPASPKDVTMMQRRLIRAGFRSQHALRTLYGAKLALGVGLPILLAFVVLRSDLATDNKVIAIAGAAIAGFFGPNEYVKMASRKRQREVHRGLPNALDLLVVCVESGLGLDQAVLQVSRELDKVHPEISEEFGLVTLELKAGKRRVEALRNLAERTAVEELKKLVAVLIQADRFGTSVAQSLRGHADFMRVQTRQQAEEKAAKLGVKLVFPIFFCILPALFVVTVGPVAVKIMRELVPTMNSF